VSGRVIREGHDVGKWVILSGGVTRDLTATIGPDGSFSFANVRSGTYTLRVGPNIAPRPITITVGDKDISGLEVVLPKSVVTSAAVTFNVDLQVEGSEPLPPLPDFWLILDKTDASLPPFRITPSGSTLVSEMPFAEYRAYVSSFRDLLLNAHGPLPPGYTVKSVRAGSTDLLKEPLKISASGEVSIAIMLAYKAPARFKVSGRVTGLATAPVKAETVTLSGIELDEPLTSPIASDGAFHFTGLLPGSYRLTLQPQSDPFPREILVGNSDQAKVEIAMVIPSRKVSGRIVDVATLGPLGPNDFVELTLSVTSKWWPSWPWSTESIARADGSFVFNEVPIQPGPYLLEIALCRNHSCVSNSAGQSLDLADRDVSDLRISIANESKE
jgi:hypothetical protein